jgi:hypothetical protein
LVRSAWIRIVADESLYFLAWPAPPQGAEKLSAPQNNLNASKSRLKTASLCFGRQENTLFVVESGAKGIGGCFAKAGRSDCN